MTTTGVLGPHQGDYAACIGTTGANFTLDLPNNQRIPSNGACKPQQGLPFNDITGGLSSTLLVGEKHIPLGDFGQWPWDCSIYDGHNPVCNTRSAGPDFPLAVNLNDQGVEFGSYHPFVCPFVFCDGHVQAVRNTINPVTLGLLAQQKRRRFRSIRGRARRGGRARLPPSQKGRLGGSRALPKPTFRLVPASEPS